MFRRLMLAALLALPLSCASSGSTAEDDSPVQTNQRFAVDYTVSCAPDRTISPATDCRFEVTYRTAEGMTKRVPYMGNEFWIGHFGAVSGDTAVMTVKRRGGTARLHLAIWIDLDKGAFRILDGAGPVTLKAVIP